MSAAGLLCCAGDASGTHTAGGSPGHTEQISYCAILSHAADQSVGLKYLDNLFCSIYSSMFFFSFHHHHIVFVCPQSLRILPVKK